MQIGHLVFGLAGLLALVSFMPPIAGRLRLPYSVLFATVAVIVCTVAVGFSLDSMLLKPRLAVPDQEIAMQVGRMRVMYFVASGAVTIHLPDQTTVELGTGEIFGEMALAGAGSSLAGKNRYGGQAAFACAGGVAAVPAWRAPAGSATGIEYEGLIAVA